MIVFFGTRNYGKVDHVPGLFYVVTSFFYIQYVPLVPTGSYLMIDDGSERGMNLGLNFKSVFFAYLRAITMVGGIGAVILGVTELRRDAVLGGMLIGAGIGAILLFFLSYKLAKPSPARAVRLAGQAGIPPELVAQFFVDAPIDPDSYPVPQVEEVEAADDEVLPADEKPRARRRPRYDDDDDFDERYDDRPARPR